jgi:hypothetical protein
MPYTPLHLGPSGVAALLFPKKIDVPVFLLVNIVVDLEVWVASALRTGPLPIRYGHTLLIAGAAGLAFGAAAYPLKGLFSRAMEKLRLHYETSFKKMALSGLLGAWLHVLIDGLYRSNVVLFWPSTLSNPFCRFDKVQVETACLIMLVIALIMALGRRS